MAAYFSKILFVGATATDVGVLCVLAASAGFHEAWSHLKLNSTMNKRLDELEAKLKEAEKADQEIRTFLSNQKLERASRGMSVGR